LVQIFLSASNSRTDLSASDIDSSCTALLSVTFGQAKFFFSSRAFGTLREFTCAVIFGFHLERTSPQTFVPPGTCSIV
jgi:hypothetical protein